MENKVRLRPRRVFRKRGACSNAMFYLLNHEFENKRPAEERASDILAGGIVQKGEQCGMLWGAALAVGAESYKINKDKDLAVVMAVNASRHLIKSFNSSAGAVNCSEITNTDWDNKFQAIKFMIKTLSRGMVFSPCFNLINKWTPEAIEAAKKGLAENVEFKKPCLSCSEEVIKKMGGTEEEAVMVSGFAGGIALSGNACGAMAAAIWYKNLVFIRENPDKKLSMFDNKDAKKIIEVFNSQTHSEMRCEKICKRKFNSVDEHCDYIQSGGCGELIDAIAEV